MLMFSKNIRCYFLLMGLSSGAYSADSLPAAPFGALQTSSNIKIISSDVEIKGKQVTGAVRVKNIEKKTSDGHFFYELPAFKWEGLSDDYFDKNFPEFALESEKNKIIPKITIKAYINNKNISNILETHGIDPLLVASADINKFPFISENNIFLEKKGIFKRAEDQYIPEWSLAIKLEWKHKFTNNEKYAFNSRYLARPGFSILNIDDDFFNKKLNTYCADLEKTHFLINKEGIKSKYFLVEEYDIPMFADVPHNTSMNYTSKQDNSNFTPLAVFQCKDNFESIKHTSPSSFIGLNARLKNIKFMLLSYSVDSEH
ncbi:DUF4424 family protein [Iodobacter ciconiae]|uniref:DUF4424 domain-containing protein n=1 Tax=Iodobacter ciconiae TaxID=2496266 RepID=A0A3S8ZS71_9NEIS|nr:DUF4424 family protein [Iodobacter ciconiae]AZN36332.1 DUF4424 domain-containing protein [Iodobacter ciconiae]